MLTAARPQGFTGAAEALRCASRLTNGGPAHCATWNSTVRTRSERGSSHCEGLGASIAWSCLAENSAVACSKPSCGFETTALRFRLTLHAEDMLGLRLFHQCPPNLLTTLLDLHSIGQDVEVPARSP